MLWFSDKRPDVVSIRYLELGIALYTGISGILFVFFPSVFASPVYDPWREFGIFNWGLCMLLVSALHVGALIWNGKSQLYSRIWRTFACIGHSAIMLTFGLFFFSAGALWGCVLFLVLLPYLLLPVIYRLNGEIKGIRLGVNEYGPE